jgi:hypothetical protein
LALEAAPRSVADEPTDAFPLWPAIDEPPTAEAQPVPVAPAVSQKAHQNLDQWPPPLLRASLQTRVSEVASAPARRQRPDKPLKPLRRPGSGLAALLLFALLSGFFGWTAAEPLWLALGHAQRGTATVTRCSGQGVLRRCVATFTTPGTESTNGFTVDDVTLLGARPGADKAPGAHLAAEMVRRGDRIAYAGDRNGLHVRWGVGLGLTVLCGLGIAWVTGARRLIGRRARTGAVLLSLAGPLLLFAGMLASTF